MLAVPLDDFAIYVVTMAYPSTEQRISIQQAEYLRNIYFLVVALHVAQGVLLDVSRRNVSGSISVTSEAVPTIKVNVVNRLKADSQNRFNYYIHYNMDIVAPHL